MQQASLVAVCTKLRVVCRVSDTALLKCFTAVIPAVAVIIQNIDGDKTHC